MSFAFAKPEKLYPELGAEYTGEGTHFGVFSENAQAIELCLFSDDGAEEVARIELPTREGSIFSGYMPGIKPGQLYGYRAHGALSQRKAIASIPINCCSIPMRARLPVRSNGMMRSGAMICRPAMI